MAAPKATPIDPIAVNGGRTDDPRYPANSRTYPANQSLNAMNTVGEYTDTGSNNNPYRNAVDQNPNTTSAYDTPSVVTPTKDYAATTTTETPAYSGDYDLSEYLRQQAAARIENELAGLRGAYQQSMRGYDNELKNIQKQYYGLRNDAAAQDAIARRNFDERAAASGLNSGTAGQADLVRSAAYTGELARLGSAEEDARRDIEMQRANAESQYEQAIAQAKAQNDQDLASALYQELIRVQGLEREDALNAAKAASSSIRYYTGNPSSKDTTDNADTAKWSAVDTWVGLYGADAAADYIKANYKTMGFENQTQALSAYNNHLREIGQYQTTDSSTTQTTQNSGKTNNPSTPSWVGEVGNNSFKNPRNVQMYWIEGDVPQRLTPDGNRAVDAYSKYLSMDEINNLWSQGIINRAINSKGQIVYSWA